MPNQTGQDFNIMDFLKLMVIQGPMYNQQNQQPNIQAQTPDGKQMLMQLLNNPQVINKQFEQSLDPMKSAAWDAIKLGIKKNIQKRMDSGEHPGQVADSFGIINPHAGTNPSQVANTPQSMATPSTTNPSGVMPGATTLASTQDNRPYYLKGIGGLGTVLMMAGAGMQGKDPTEVLNNLMSMVPKTKLLEAEASQKQAMTEWMKNDRATDYTAQLNQIDKNRDNLENDKKVLITTPWYVISPIEKNKKIKEINDQIAIHDKARETLINDYKLKFLKGGTGGSQQFNVGGKIYDIPADKVEAFKKAKGIK